MIRTPLIDFFAPEQVKALKDSYAINSMEQLLSLRNTSICLDGLAKAIGINKGKFFSILDKAEKNIKVTKRSKKRYMFGAHIHQ